MKNLYASLTALLLCLLPFSLQAQTQFESIKGKPTRLNSCQWAAISPHLNVEEAKIEKSEDAKAILSAFQDVAGNKDFAVLIHVLRWKKTNGGQVLEAHNWHVYQEGAKKDWLREDLLEKRRLYGVQKLYVLYLHLDNEEDYEVRYKISIKKKLPAYVNRLLSVLSLPGGSAAEAVCVDTNHYFGLEEIKLKYRVSDITIEPNILTASKTLEKLGDAVTFDNEGLYFFDFSIGAPIRRIRELEFNLTGNTVTPKTVDRQTAFAFLNLYPKPVDIKNTNFSYVPHFVGGVALAQRPLHRILVGGGWGPVFANFYAGALFVKQAEMPAAGQTNAPMKFKYKTQFAFGVNLPIGAVLEKLKTSQ